MFIRQTYKEGLGLSWMSIFLASDIFLQQAGLLRHPSIIHPSSVSNRGENWSGGFQSWGGLCRIQPELSCTELQIQTPNLVQVTVVVFDNTWVSEIHIYRGRGRTTIAHCTHVGAKYQVTFYFWITFSTSKRRMNETAEGLLSLLGKIFEIFNHLSILFQSKHQSEIAILVCLYIFSTFLWEWRFYLWFHNQLESAMPQRNHFVKAMAS